MAFVLRWEWECLSWRKEGMQFICAWSHMWPFPTEQHLLLLLKLLVLHIRQRPEETKRGKGPNPRKKICHFQRRPRLQHCTPSVSALLDLFQVSRDRCSSDQSHNALYSEHRENQCGLIASQYPVPCQVSNSLFSDNERFCSGNLNSVRVR